MSTVNYQVWGRDLTAFSSTTKTIIKNVLEGYCVVLDDMRTSVHDNGTYIYDLEKLMRVWGDHNSFAMYFTLNHRIRLIDKTFEWIIIKERIILF